MDHLLHKSGHFDSDMHTTVAKNMNGTWQGQESICWPVNLKSNLLPFVHWPADRLLAPPGPFHVMYLHL